VTTTHIDRTSISTARRRKSPSALPLIAGGIGLLALVVRLALRQRGFDLFGDEALYVAMGRSVISGGFPHWYYNGQFFLHGPAFFYLEAAWAHLVGNQPSEMAWVYQMRTLNVLFAAGTAVCVVVLVAQASTPIAGIAAGLIFAIEPFAIRQNDRVLLETSMMFWIVAGYLVLSTVSRRDVRPRQWLMAVAAGVLFGCALLTKDEAALLTLLPVLVATLLDWGPRRAVMALTACVALCVYGFYVTVVAINGQFANFWQQKTAGIQRMIGLIQVSGFHSSAGGHLHSRLIGEASSFLTTYAVLALAVPACIIVLRRGEGLARILGLFYCAAAVTLAYGVAKGTLEEQELYLLVVPSVMLVPLACSLLFRTRFLRATRRSRAHLALRTAVGALLFLTLAMNCLTCVQWYSAPDVAYARLLQYLSSHVPAGAAIATMNNDGQSEYGLAHIYREGVWETTAALAKNHARFIVIEWGLLQDGYSTMSPAAARLLIHDDRILFSAGGRSNGEVVLYEIRGPIQAR